MVPLILANNTFNVQSFSIYRRDFISTWQLPSVVLQIAEPAIFIKHASAHEVPQFPTFQWLPLHLKWDWKATPWSGPYPRHQAHLIPTAPCPPFCNQNALLLSSSTRSNMPQPPGLCTCYSRCQECNNHLLPFSSLGTFSFLGSQLKYHHLRDRPSILVTSSEVTLFPLSLISSLFSFFFRCVSNQEFSPVPPSTFHFSTICLFLVRLSH